MFLRELVSKQAQWGQLQQVTSLLGCKSLLPPSLPQIPHWQSTAEVIAFSGSQLYPHKAKTAFLEVRRDFSFLVHTPCKARENRPA